MPKNTIAQQIARICISAVMHGRHIEILREFYGFYGVIQFPQTIKELISIDQMATFGISKEMQIILKHINQLDMLTEISQITKAFQKEYEILHKRTVVVVYFGQTNCDDVSNVISDIASNFDENHDFIYQETSHIGISIHYGDKVIEYTPASIIKVLKSA